MRVDDKNTRGKGAYPQDSLNPSNRIIIEKDRICGECDIAES